MSRVGYVGCEVHIIDIRIVVRIRVKVLHPGLQVSGV